MKSDDKNQSDEPIVVNLDAIKAENEGSSLTLREYKELSAKDHSTLTEHERKELANARKQLIKAAESVNSHYDTTTIMKTVQSLYKISPAFQSVQSIDLSPIVKASADLQKVASSIQPALDRAYGISEAMKPAIDAIYKSTLFTQNQFAALAAMQKSLATFPTENIVAAVKSIQDIFQAPFIARTMFADFHTAHERVKHSLRLDVGSLGTSIEFSRSEIVGVELADVAVADNNLTATANARHTNETGNIAFVDDATFMLAFNDLRHDVQELKQLMLAKNIPQGKMLVEPTSVHFQRKSSKIRIGRYEVSVTTSSKQTTFARYLVNDPTKCWDIEEHYTDFP